MHISFYFLILILNSIIITSNINNNYNPNLFNLIDFIENDVLFNDKIDYSEFNINPTSEIDTNNIKYKNNNSKITIDGYLFDWNFSDIVKIGTPKYASFKNCSASLNILSSYSRIESHKLFIRLDFLDIVKINWSENFILILVDLDGKYNNNYKLIQILEELNLINLSNENNYLRLVDIAIIITNLNNKSKNLFNFYLDLNCNIHKIDEMAYNTIVGGIEFSCDLEYIKLQYLNQMNFLNLLKHCKINVYTYKIQNNNDNSQLITKKIILEDELSSIEPNTLKSRMESSQQYSQKVKIAFIHHGNQPFRATDWNGNPDWIKGIIYDPNGVVDHDNGIADGYHYSLKAHEDYNIPLDLELTATVLSAIQYEEPEFLERIRKDIKEGILQIVGTVYAQQKLPYYPEDMNEWAIKTSKQMIKHVIDPNDDLNLPLNVIWIPDRTWKDLPNVILPISKYYSAIVLDDRPHFDDFGGSEDYHEPHLLTSSVSHYKNNLTVFFICTTFRDDIFQPEILRAHWSYLASLGNPRIVCVYGDDWEKSCGNGFFDNKDDYATYYRNTLHTIASIPWIEPTTLTEITKNITAGTWSLNYNITIISDTAPYIDGNGYYGKADEFYYGMTGYYDEYNHYDYWYKIWKNWVPNTINPYFSYTTKTLEQLWQEAYNSLYLTSINNDLIELGKHILASSQHETAFGTGENNWGNERLFDWQKRQSEHARYGNVFAYAANWANGVKNGTINGGSQYEHKDIDNDGVKEYILKNKNILAIFDPIGGKLQWLFGYQNNYPVLLAGNSIVFFDGNDYHTGGIESGFGDYNDYGHQYCLSDSRISKIYDDQPFDYDLNYVSQPRSLYDKLRLDNFTYSLSFVPIIGGVKLNAYCIETGLSKNITLQDNSWDLEIDYDTGSSNIYIYNGFTPNLLSLIYNGNNLNVSYSNNSFSVENTEFPARVGLEWSNNINITYKDSSLFEERVEINGTGSFSFNISAKPPSPIRIFNVSYTSSEIGKSINITSYVYSMIDTNITSVNIFYRIFNGSWSEYFNGTMNLVDNNSRIYVYSLPANASNIGNIIEFYIYTEDDSIPKNSRTTKTYQIKGSEPLYHSIKIDGINDFKQQEKISTDPQGDSGDLQVDLLELYTSWDAENIYFGINISSSTNLMEWGGSNPASIYLAIDVIPNSGYKNISNTYYGDMWNRAIKFNGTNLPDFELHATLNKYDPYIQYSIFDNTTMEWKFYNTTGVKYSYAATNIGIFMEISIEWNCLKKLGSLWPIINVLAGVCGGYDGDSVIDSIPNDPTTNHLDGGSNEWVDIDEFDSNRFANIEWDKNNDTIPDYISAEIVILQPLNNSIVSEMVSIEIEAIASTLAEYLNISLNTSVIYSYKCSSNKGSIKFLWNSNSVKNGIYIFQIYFALSDNSVISANLSLRVLNKYETYINFTNSLKPIEIFGTYDIWVFYIKVFDKYNDSVAGVMIEADIEIITYEKIIKSRYITLTNDEGECIINIPLDYIGSYIISINAIHSSYKSSSAMISLQLINKYPKPNYINSIIVFSIILIGFLGLNFYYIYLQIKKGGIRQ